MIKGWDEDTQKLVLQGDGTSAIFDPQTQKSEVIYEQKRYVTLVKNHYAYFMMIFAQLNQAY